MSNDETQIQQALITIAKAMANEMVKELKYDCHFEGYVVAVNENNTCDVYCDERNKTFNGIRYSTSTPAIGKRVQVRETVGVPNSYLVDFIL